VGAEVDGIVAAFVSVRRDRLQQKGGAALFVTLAAFGVDVVVDIAVELVAPHTCTTASGTFPVMAGTVFSRIWSVQSTVSNMTRLAQ